MHQHTQVVGTDIPQGPQKLALVVTGGLLGADDPFTVVDGDGACAQATGCGEGNCGRFGDCRDGACECHPTHAGGACELELPRLQVGGTLGVRVGANSWQYLVWEGGASLHGWHVTVEFADDDSRTRMGQDPDLYLAWNRCEWVCSCRCVYTWEEDSWTRMGPGLGTGGHFSDR